MAQIPFALESYISRSPSVSSQRVVNLYSELQPEEVNAKSKVVLFGCPGIVDFATVGPGPIRAFYELKGVVYVVSGSGFYSLSSAGVATFIGTGLSIGTGPVGIADNGVEIALTDGINGFIYNTDTFVWQQISDVDFYAADQVQHVDSYFIFNRKNTNQFFSSESLIGTSYPPLFFASADSQSDFTLSPINHLQQLLIAGKQSIEVWYMSGGTGMPWTRHQGVAIQMGIMTPFAWVKVREDLYLLGSNRIFYKLQGTQLVRMSKHATEQAWQGYGDVSDAFVFAMTWEGHDFIYLTFPGARKTWCLDGTTGLWHERESVDASYNSIGRWCVNSTINAYNKQLVGDVASGKVGYLSATTYTEFGNPIRAIAVGPPMHNEGKRVFMPNFELSIQSGVGLTSGQGSDPQLILSVSDDGGHTFLQVPWKSMGKIGEYTKRLRWTGMGSFYERSMMLMITDPVYRAIVASFVDLESEE